MATKITLVSSRETAFFVPLNSERELAAFILPYIQNGSSERTLSGLTWVMPTSGLSLWEQGPLTEAVVSWGLLRWKQTQGFSVWPDGRGAVLIKNKRILLLEKEEMEAEQPNIFLYSMWTFYKRQEVSSSVVKSVSVLLRCLWNMFN